MNLHQQQLSLLNIIKSRLNYDDITDPYLCKVAAHPNLMLAKKIINWWRKQQVQSYCTLTCNLLAWEGTLDERVFEFSSGDFSVFREEVGLDFIIFINKQNPAPLLKAVSLFEQALINVKCGSLVEQTIFWPYELSQLYKGYLTMTLVRNCFSPEITK